MLFFASKIVLLCKNGEISLIVVSAEKKPKETIFYICFYIAFCGKFTTVNWSFSFPFKEYSCPSNSHYELCGTSCPAACPSLSFPFLCTQPCQEGCQCNDGLLLSGDSCVPPTGCGCLHEGRYRQGGESFWYGEGCQSLCICNGTTGFVRCSTSSCSEQETCRIVEGEYGCHPRPHATCSASGDPHYTSFDGRTFDFQGTCRYVLTTVCNRTRGLPYFQVIARNEAWQGLPVSITVEVYVNVSGHMIDSQTRNLPVLLDSGRVSIYSSGQNTFITTDFGLIVSYDGSWVVRVTVPANYSGATCGLCGNFNGQRGDDFRKRSENDTLCSDGCGDSCSSCQNPVEPRAQCQILRDSQGPLSFCHATVDPQAYFDDCVFDLCISENRHDVLCRSIQTYVSACQTANVVIYPWRQNTTCSEYFKYNRHLNSTETCQSSSATMSLSRCQLFEAGFPANVLHLSDPSCRGTVENGRLVFHFDNDDHICGTNLTVLNNSKRCRGIDLILFFCILLCYALTSLFFFFKHSIVSKILPDGQGMYQVRMIPYEDAAFSHPYNGTVDIVMDQKIYVEVNVQGVDSRQISTVIDSCWATPVNDRNYAVRWDLIINKCPNPNDISMEVLQNGVSTTARFSLKMFAFRRENSRVYLHCAIHLCLLRDNNCAVVSVLTL
uniref:ZP domain-containing protein n=1 Tax=Pygocentrus nattereri TaxID=42514 RepID=A0AAR2JUD2_PYGNA